MGAFLGTLGLLISSGVSQAVAVLMSLPFALILFILSQTVVPRLDDARQRRNDHRRMIVRRGVITALDHLRPLAKRNLLEELRRLRPLHETSRRFESPEGQHWDWLLQHDERIVEAATAMANAESKFLEAYDGATSTIVEELRGEGWTPMDEMRPLKPKEVRGRVLANVLLDEAATDHPDFRRHLRDLRGSEEDATVSADMYVVARAPRADILTLASLPPGIDKLVSLADALRQPHVELLRARSRLLDVLEAIEAEGMVSGLCAACPPHPLWPRRRQH